MPYEFDGKVHVYEASGGYDEYWTLSKVEDKLTKEQYKRLMSDGWVTVDGVVYEL